MINKKTMSLIMAGLLSIGLLVNPFAKTKAYAEEINYSTVKDVAIADFNSTYRFYFFIHRI